MSNTIDPHAIEINKAGVHVGGHSLPGVTRWAVRHDYERGLHEIQLNLCTSNLRVDLGPGDNGMITVYERNSPAEAPRLAQHCSAAGPIGVSKGMQRPDGSVETKHYGPAAEVSQ